MTNKFWHSQIQIWPYLLVLLTNLGTCPLAFAENKPSSVLFFEFTIHQMIDEGILPKNTNPAELTKIIKDGVENAGLTLASVSEDDGQDFFDLLNSKPNFVLSFGYWNENSNQLDQKEMEFFSQLSLQEKNLEKGEPLIFMMLFCRDTTKSSFWWIPLKQISDNNITDVVDKAMQKFPINVQDLLNIKADRVISHENSVTQYVLPSVNSEPISVDIDYSAEKDFVQNVTFSPTVKLPDGERQYTLETHDGQKLNITFFVKNELIENVRLETDAIPKNEDSQILTVVSQGGFPMNFEFSWDKQGQVSNVKVFPQENPYEPILVSWK